MLVVADGGGMVCLDFLVVVFAGRFSVLGVHSIDPGAGRFFVRWRPRLAPVGFVVVLFGGRSFSGTLVKVEPFRLRVVVGRVVFKKMECGSCSGGMVRVV